jgi:predicted RNA-binding protein YlxR (DUF448 family)
MNTSRKHIPQRTCAVCRTKDAKRKLTRVVKTPEGRIELDATGKASGRGAYLCDRAECWVRAAETNALGAALRVVITDDARALLRQHIPSQ